MNDGIRFQFTRVSFGIEVIEHPCDFEVNVLDHAIGYENAVTGKVSIVPLVTFAGSMTAVRELLVPNT
ncbi:MAG: hypothetical protein ABI627_01230 [Polyangiaceae bacterium]